MGMSTYVIAFRPPDERWKKMADIYAACEAAGIDPPKEVAEFFNYEKPDPRGVEIEVPVTEWCSDDRASSGYELAVADIPSGVTHIRFRNSW